MKDPAARRAYQKKHYEANKADYVARARAHDLKNLNECREYIQALKSTTPCLDCGKTYPAYVMDFDHVGDDKEFNVADWSTRKYSLKRLRREIDKCEIVCSNCHRKRTHTRKTMPGDRRSVPSPDS